jgi:hypothetical protein
MVIVVPSLAHRQNGYWYVFGRTDSPATSYSSAFTFEACNVRAFGPTKGEITGVGKICDYAN